MAAIAVSFLMHLPHLQKDLISIHVWRQTQTQSTIDNFYKEDMNILNPRRNQRGNGDGIFRMEFPLAQWLVAGVYQITGPSIAVSRIVMWVFSITAIGGMFMLSALLLNSKLAAAIEAWALTFSPSFFYHSFNPMPDILAMSFGIWGLYFFFRSEIRSNRRQLFMACALLALSALCKLPFIVLYAAPIWKLIQSLRTKATYKSVLPPLSLIALPIWWYAWVIPSWSGNPTVGGITGLDFQFSELLSYLSGTLISTLPELLINYGSLLFFITGIYLVVRERWYKKGFFSYLLLPFLGAIAYYLYEIKAIETIHDYYLYPFMPFIFLLVGAGAHWLYNQSQIVKRFSLIMLLLLPLFCFLRMEDRWNPAEPGFNPDFLKYKEELRSAVPDDELVIVGNDHSGFISFYYIDKMGWSFGNDQLGPNELLSMRFEGAKYLYIDSEEIVNSSDFKALQDQGVIQNEIAKFGTIRVFELSSVLDEIASLDEN